MLLMAQAQQFASVTITATDNKKFTVYIDGAVINSTPASAIRIEKLKKVCYQFKILSEDAKVLPLVREKFFVCNKSGALRDFVYSIQTINPVLKLSFVSMKTMQTTHTQNENIFVYDFEQHQIFKKADDVAITPNKDTNTISTQAINSKIEDSSKIQNQRSITVVKEPADWHCKSEWPMWKADFEKGKSLILSEKSGNQQLKKAKEFTGKFCLTTEQVIEIGQLLKDEDSKLDYVLFAIAHTIDIKNFYKAEKVFVQEKTKSIFTNFISK